jgi:hypothetical protein
VVRPISVFISTIGTGLTLAEKTYLSLIAPRGILAAAMASYFAAELRQRGLAGANRIEMLVFLTIGATVCLQGSWASILARLLKVQPGSPSGVLLVGVNELSLILAKELRTRGCLVLFLDNSPNQCDLARSAHFLAYEGDATDRATFRHLDMSAIGTVLAITSNDAVNTLACEAAGEALPHAVKLQVVSKPGGEATRSRVRLAGNRALPTTLPQGEIIQKLVRGEFVVAAVPCNAETTITADLATSGGPTVPLLILDSSAPRVAVEGSVCPAKGTILGLRPIQGHIDPLR